MSTAQGIAGGGIQVSAYYYFHHHSSVCQWFNGLNSKFMTQCINIISAGSPIVLTK